MKKMIVVLSIIALIVFLGSRFLMINTKDTAVDPEKFLGNKSNPASIYSGPSEGVFYSPVNIAVANMDKLMLVDFKDDPEYVSIELQTFDDARGRGARVILYHHQGPADSYYTDSVFVMRPLEGHPFRIEPDIAYHFEVTPSGLDASMKMKDYRGKSVGFQIRETSRKKWSKGFLAPIGAGEAISFPYFPFFHMKDMNFVSRSGTEISVQIDGVERKPQNLPVPVNLEFVYLSRYTPAPIIACWNTPQDGILQPFDPGKSQEYRDGLSRYELADNEGHSEIRRMIGTNERHRVEFEFSPAIPDLSALKDGFTMSGRFCAGADETPGIIAGDYRIVRHGKMVDMEIQPQKGWQPISGKLWVKRWVWKGTIFFGENKEVTIKSKWIRQ